MAKKFQVWIAILIGELLWLNSSVHQPYDIGNLLLILAIIIVTCSVGAVGFFLFKQDR